jgi:hypothetical protein
MAPGRPRTLPRLHLARHGYSMHDVPLYFSSVNKRKQFESGVARTLSSSNESKLSCRPRQRATLWDNLEPRAHLRARNHLPDSFNAQLGCSAPSPNGAVLCTIDSSATNCITRSNRPKRVVERKCEWLGSESELTRNAGRTFENPDDQTISMESCQRIVPTLTESLTATLAVAMAYTNV